ncbi:hypothetical protein SDRG_04360 [Saprolegnia diclina VS20]|uniref:BRCT domain-containing protein n=1 Tax=Saprolegnia diclina (strain VS20) TaxID=1156394 RepID=T0QKT8_SAPDV|nr:hypothetical protein SDRG_04360 [Saprolegnia diclina VS20]EQC38664.1 hypothetical protein SDRG_04360 [Saprolegnia diclina VS20]|eukprot:XP_008608256.1 hypothetical protein SDRG_04360 [Saprolegnia diclina VS20]
METAMDVLDRFVAAEESVVDKLFRSRGQTLRLELQSQRMLSPESQNQSSGLATFPCLLLFPQLDAAHRALLAGLRLVKTQSPTLSDRARSSAELLFERALEFKTLHATYAWYHQLMPPPSDPKLDALFRLPLDCLEAYAVCMDALAPFAERPDDWYLMCDRLHDAFSDITTQRTRAMDMLALEEGLGSGIDLVARTLIAQNVVSIQMTGDASLQTGTLYLFEDLCLIVDTNGHDLFQLQAAEVCKALRIPNTPDCFLLTQDAHCTILAAPAVVHSLLTCINERFLAPDTFAFDLHSLLHTMDSGLPTDWLVPNSEAAQQALVRSDLVWLYEKDRPRPMLCQFFLLHDMILYGEVVGMAHCKYLGYFLGEYVSLRQHDVENVGRLELLVAHAETQHELLLVLEPLDPTATALWQQHIASFVRVPEATAPLDESSVTMMHDESSVTTMASTADAITSPPPFASPKTTWRKKKPKALTPSSTETHLPTPTAEPTAEPTSRTETPALDSNETNTASQETSGVRSGVADEPPSAATTILTSIVPIAARGTLRDPIDDDTVASTPDTPDARQPRGLAMSEASVNDQARDETKTKRRPPAKKKLLNETAPLIVEFDDDVPLARDIASKPTKAKPPAKKKAPAKSKKRAGPVTPRTAPIANGDVTTPAPVFTTAVPTSSGKKRKAKATLVSPVLGAPAIDESDDDAPLRSKMAKTVPDFPPSTQDMEGSAIQILCRIADAPPSSSSAPSPTVLRIVLTGFVSTDALLFEIAAIASAQYEDDVMTATHIIAPRGKFKRTVKILCGISRCLHILDEEWLHASAALGYAAPEAQYCLKDDEKEALWGFTLRRTMYEFSLAQRQRLLRGHSFYVATHKSILPPPGELTKIITCAGGEMTSGLPKPDTIVIASKEAVATSAVQKQLQHMSRDKCFSVELLLIGILQQTLQWDAFRIHCPLPRKGR